MGSACEATQKISSIVDSDIEACLWQRPQFVFQTTQGIQDGHPGTAMAKARLRRLSHQITIATLSNCVVAKRKGHAVNNLTAKFMRQPLRQSERPMEKTFDVRTLSKVLLGFFQLAELLADHADRPLTAFSIQERSTISSVRSGACQLTCETMPKVFMELV